jgi:hypothetical protein
MYYLLGFFLLVQNQGGDTGSRAGFAVLYSKEAIMCRVIAWSLTPDEIPAATSRALKPTSWSTASTPQSITGPTSRHGKCRPSSRPTWQSPPTTRSKVPLPLRQGSRCIVSPLTPVLTTRMYSAAAFWSVR